MPRFVYKVRCLVDKDVAEKWINFFNDKHLEDVLNTGFFTECNFYEIETQSKLTRTFCCEYFYEKEEHLEAYNENAAAMLKAETKKLFGDRFSCQRELMRELTSLKASALSSV